MEHNEVKILAGNIIIAILIHVVILPMFIPFDIVNMYSSIIRGVMIVIQSIIFWLLLLYVNGYFKKKNVY